jgi:hypothetical protein
MGKSTIKGKSTLRSAESRCSSRLVWLFSSSSIKLHHSFLSTIAAEPIQFVGAIACGKYQMIDVARLLPKLLKATGENPEMAEIAAKLAWTRAAGEGLRRHAIPFRLSRQTLTVSVADAIWQKQMQSMSLELLARINRLLGREVVTAIEFRIDPATVELARARISAQEQKETRPPVTMPAELVTAAKEIADDDLRARFMRAAENCIARRESRTED